MSNEELLVGGAVLGGMLTTVFLVLLVFYVLTVIATWKIFTKAEIAGWKSLIPIYNAYLLFKIAGVSFWIYALGLPFVSGILSSIGQNSDDAVKALFSLASAAVIIYSQWKFSEGLAKSFKKGMGFAFGLLFLPNIFLLVLGFGDAKYEGKAE